MSLKNAFNALVNLRGKEMQLQKADASKTIALKVAVANFDRNMAMVEDTTSQGYEFVVSSDSLKDFGRPKRGDRFIDSEYGTNTITSVKPQTELSGAILGYRVRCD